MNKVILALVLLALILVGLELCSKKVPGQKDMLTIVAAEKVVTLPYADLQKKMTAAAMAKRGSQWEGIFMVDLLRMEKINPDKFPECTLTARDGMKITIPSQEITQRQAFLTFTQGKKDKQPQLKLVMLQDEFEQRWLKYIVKIQLHYPE
jgi:hypothetical protein